MNGYETVLAIKTVLLYTAMACFATTGLLEFVAGNKIVAIDALTLAFVILIVIKMDEKNER